MPESAIADMGIWIAQVRQQLSIASPDMLPLFDVYAEESLFGRRFISDDLARLPERAEILEVGAGAMLLSCQLMREGFCVTALEPVGTGFSHIGQLREAVFSLARATDRMPRVINQTAETFTDPDRFAYAFSINVMEHVLDVARTLDNINKSLIEGGIYRFTCPNYLFPYEPHFNIPTLFSKQLTQRWLRKRILSDARLPDAAGTWQSLNWINVLQVARIARRIGRVEVRFNRCLLGSTFERVVTDVNFAKRRSPFARRVIHMLVRFRIHSLLRFIPATLQPIIDCSLRKCADSKAH